MHLIHQSEATLRPGHVLILLHCLWRNQLIRNTSGQSSSPFLPIIASHQIHWCRNGTYMSWLLLIDHLSVSWRIQRYAVTSVRGIFSKPVLSERCSPRIFDPINPHYIIMHPSSQACSLKHDPFSIQQWHSHLYATCMGEVVQHLKEGSHPTPTRCS